MLARAAARHACAPWRQQQALRVVCRAMSHRVTMILKQDVPNLGYRGDEVSVKAGYARNYLYPEKMAVYATEANRTLFKVNRETKDEAEVEKERALEEIVKRLTSVTVRFKRHTPTRQEQTLHTCVTAEQISDALEKQHGIVVGVARIDLPTPIKTLGSHSVKVRVDDEVTKEVANAEATATAATEQGEERPTIEPAPIDHSKKRIVKVAIEIERR